MFEQDYIMRLIKEMVRLLLKLLFHIDTAAPTAEILCETEERKVLDNLLDLVDDGKINEAENRIYELTLDGNIGNLEIALLFYFYLNDKTDEFLERNNYSRKEIKEGLEDVISRYGFGGLTDLFLMEL